MITFSAWMILNWVKWKQNSQNLNLFGALYGSGIFEKGPSSDMMSNIIIIYRNYLIQGRFKIAVRMARTFWYLSALPFPWCALQICNEYFMSFRFAPIRILFQLFDAFSEIALRIFIVNGISVFFFYFQEGN